MAIKTTGTGSALRIITKTVNGEVRVSCECCAAGCCMYAGDQLGVNYSAADLPDAITIDGESVSRDGTSYEGNFTSVRHEEGEWRGYIGDAFLPLFGNCLFEETGFPDFFIRDQFADTYTVTGLPDGWPQQSVQIVRESLCQWLGNAGGQETRVVLTYWDGSDGFVPAGATNIGWWLTVGEQSNDSIGRGGNQSRPDGSYGIYEVL